MTKDLELYVQFGLLHLMMREILSLIDREEGVTLLSCKSELARM